jgi:hypothetical protein
MTKQEYIRILVMLSQLEGYMLGKIGIHIPEPMAEELAEISELLAKYIRGETT